MEGGGVTGVWLVVEGAEAHPANTVAATIAIAINTIRRVRYIYRYLSILPVLAGGRVL